MAATPTNALARVLVHVVTYNHAETIIACLQSVLESRGSNVSIQVRVTDNASDDKTAEKLAGIKEPNVEIVRNASNLGFCGAHNQGVATFLQGEFDFLLILNPDIRLEGDAIERMRCRFSVAPAVRVGVVGALLLRADHNLMPVEPRRYDSTGIEMYQSLRHLDGGSNQLADAEDAAREVFGISGACLMLSRACIEDALLPRVAHEDALFKLYPQLAAGFESRPQLFDEGFFAYREDADLAWRLRLFNWCAWLETAAQGYHVRHVLPERRSALAPELNKLGVRNRFLLQIHQFSFAPASLAAWGCLLQGLLFRNLLVIAAVVLRERSSLSAFSDLRLLWRRAIEQRRYIFSKRRAAPRAVYAWFKL